MQLAELGDVSAAKLIVVCDVLHLFVLGTLHLPSVVTETVPLQMCQGVQRKSLLQSCCKAERMSARAQGRAPRSMGSLHAPAARN